MEVQFTDICVCHPPLKVNNFENMIYITYDLDAICPHCKAPFRECKPELIVSNLETEKKMVQESFNSQLEDLIEDMNSIKQKEFKESMLSELFLIIVLVVTITILIFE